jgi:hypothetical protein
MSEIDSLMSRDNSRRDFLKQGSVAAGAVLTSGLVVPRGVHAQGADSDTLKIGLVGCGGRGSGAAAQALAFADLGDDLAGKSVDPAVGHLGIGHRLVTRRRSRLEHQEREGCAALGRCDRCATERVVKAAPIRDRRVAGSLLVGQWQNRRADLGA